MSASTTVTTGFVSHDPAFAAVLGDAPQLLRVIATDAHEGPVYVAAEDALYFTTVPRTVAGVPRVAIKRLLLDGGRLPLEPERVEVVVADANVANGMTLGRDGALLVCEQGTRRTPARIARLDPRTGRRDTVVDAPEGVPLNSPNDVVEAADGSIWFTDPSYGHLQGFRPPPRTGDHVYRHDPRSGRTTVVAVGFDKPNGIALAPDGRTLYVTDSGVNQEPGSFHPERPHHVVAFDVRDGGRLGGGRVLAVIAPGFPDGIKTDADGRVFVSAASGVQVLAPAGDLLGEIVLPGAVNFTFAGPRRDVLLITTDDAIWAAILNTTGAAAPKGVPQP
jgi:gluconolactonase